MPNHDHDLPMTAPYAVLDDFLPIEVAQAMRADIEAHFANPDLHGEAQQIWNYWHVPGLYTYLRTHPEKVIDPERVEHFMSVLRAWSVDALGLGEVSWPFLSLYVSGCRQNLHNDSENGRFAFVYSLTSNERKTSGGETIIMNEGDPFRNHLASSNAGQGFYSAIEPRFNRLVVFDDRVPHAVERVEGSMQPTEGRFVLHGHMRDQGAITVGVLTSEQVSGVVMGALLAFSEKAFARLRLYHGPLILRIEVGADGKVSSCATLVDRVTAKDQSDIEWPRMREHLIEQFLALKFPKSDGVTVISQPVLLGASLFRPRH